ncbi:hypothetical protein CR513_12155, partial [Mucuna pruriens]
MPALKIETEVRVLGKLPAARYLNSCGRTRRWSRTKNAKKPSRKSNSTWSHLLFSSQQYPANL